MSDIVERLIMDSPGPYSAGYAAGYAARDDENTRLRAEVAVLREKLKPFAKSGELFKKYPSPSACVYMPAAGKEYNLSGDDLLAAHEAFHSTAPTAEAHNDRLTSIRSQAIKEFCANAGLKPSEQARGLPDDVRDFRMQAALHALKGGQEDG